MGTMDVQCEFSPDFQKCANMSFFLPGKRLVYISLVLLVGQVLDLYLIALIIPI